MANLLGKGALALIGILAFQNRDRLGEWMKDGVTPREGGVEGSALDQLLHNSGFARGGVKDVIDRFRNAGAGAEADSWVSRGPNRPVEAAHVERAIDAETLDELSAQTGMSREELLRRLARDLPEAVDRITPDGSLPEDEPSPRPASGGLLDDVPTRT